MSSSSPAKATYRNLLPWAATVGLVPCPAVVTVMLFCLSMEALVLGLCLAACICLGMATTIACVVVAVILGKAGILNVVSEKRAATLEGLLGLGSGAVIAVFWRVVSAGGDQRLILLKMILDPGFP